MRILFFCLLISSFPILGQAGKVTINQNNRLDSIIKLKKELNGKIQNLRIQIYNGDRENAESIMKEYIEIFKDSSVNIIYETPNYKIWVGNFFNQLEADKQLMDIRKKFRSAFIFRPELNEIMDEIDELEDESIPELN
ncbi:MAG: hypothetical protein CMC36_02190 [Flavobacteriaceae bacterium]|nr:hypothetical protein [Flavobacteriaceae bacterium]|tara:strand:- start:15118 stop:15531 length:414 start_codon:yes stop_codon:yes gene_type:complete